MNKCKNCAKQYFCKKDKCNFKSFIFTKNYGEVKKYGNSNNTKFTGT